MHNLINSFLKQIMNSWNTQKIPKFFFIKNDNEKSNEVFHFFYHGPFCQWYSSPFIIDGIRYNTAEQWMMAEKARIFGDEKTRARIMSANDPYDQKTLGRTVKGFDEKVWDIHKVSVVKRGNLAKFKQNKELLWELSKTKGMTLVEASPFDKIWGIGLTEDDPRALNRQNWNGQNLLGEIITSVRIELLGE